MALPPNRVAVVGSGVAGLTAAYVASRSAHVTLFEAEDRLGGHADTHLVDEPCPEEGGQHPSRRLAIDTGFIVHNQRTYPTLLRLFRELGVATQESEMSLSVRDDATGLEYAGALGMRGLFPTWRNLARPSYLRMLVEIPRFHRHARRLLDSVLSTSSAGEATLREFLEDGRFSAYFARHFMEPLVAAVWSCDPEQALDYPARYLFEFLAHHGMLGVFGSPQWRTVVGGSREYVARVGAGLPDVRTGTKVTSVLETPTGVEITDGNGEVTTYDAVVIAAHPAQALTMLAEPTPGQRDVLGAMPYSRNTAVLHTDTSVLPQAPSARASWNFQRPVADRRPVAGTEPVDCGRGPRGQVTVTYDLTRLQRLDTDIRYLVTLGGEHLVDADAVIERMEYEHPLYNPASVAAQRRLPSINTDRIAFAGAYHGWGFHEDGARSGLAAAEHLGLEWPLAVVEEVAQQPSRNPGLLAGFETLADSRSSSSGGTLYATTIRHTRRKPFTRTFENTSHTWLVDLDHLPDHRWLGRFEARDHLGDPARSIRENVESFLSASATGGDIDLTGGRILMAANARAFGYCFNPITVFWCFTSRGEQAGVVVEVHNTYGDRHAYLVHPDHRGRATTPKQMYVSPFHGTDGTYELAVPVPGQRLHVVVTLRTDACAEEGVQRPSRSDAAAFSASVTGERTDTRPWRAAPAALRGALLIRAHGLRLWARRLPVHPRPAHHQEGVR